MAASDEEYLRQLLGDPIPPVGDPLFTDEMISDIYTRSGEYMRVAAAEGWAIKAGYYAELIDLSESGATRQLSQKFKQAKEMAEYWVELDQKLTVAVTTGGVVNAPPIVGRPVDVYGSSVIDRANAILLEAWAQPAIMG